MRLIDADRLSENIYDNIPAPYEDSREAKEECLCAIEEAPTIDAVPVVRCKDCMHYLIVDEFEGGKRYMCKVNRFSYINSDGDMHYCSYGEREEDKAE